MPRHTEDKKKAFQRGPKGLQKNGNTSFQLEGWSPEVTAYQLKKGK